MCASQHAPMLIGQQVGALRKVVVQELETWGSSDRGSKLNSSPADRVAAVAAAGVGHIAAADAIARQARWKNALWVRAWSRLGSMLAGVAMPVQRPTMAIDQTAQVHLSAGTGICTSKSGRWGSAAKCLLYAASRAMFPNPLGAASARSRVRVLDPRQCLLIEFYLKLEHLDL